VQKSADLPLINPVELTHKPLKGFMKLKLISSISIVVGLLLWLTSSSVQISENTLILPINSNIHIQSNAPNVKQSP
jgi:hypothetical protein